MARMSSILGAERVKLPRGRGSDIREIWIDGVRRGEVRRITPGRYELIDDPENHPPTQRIQVVDALATQLLEAGEITLDGFVKRSKIERIVTEATKDAVAKRDNNLCQYCLMKGKRSTGREYDHFMPFSLGGTSDISNVQLACDKCNRDKWHSHPEVAFGGNWEAYEPGKSRPVG